MVLSLLVSCKNKDKIDPIPTPEPQPEMSPIEMSATTQWYGQTKGVLDGSAGLAALQERGFVVLASWKDDKDRWNDVFGVNGTAVTYDVDHWTYSPLQYWQEGVHKFMAIRPADLFQTTHPSSATGYTATSNFDDSGNMTLNVNFGTDGFQLNTADQTDMMVAYYDVDTKAQTDNASVSLSFYHQLALVSVQFKKADDTADFTVTNVKLHGNPTKASSASFAFSATANPARAVPTWTSDANSISTKNNPYYVGSDLTLTTAEQSAINEILVFPVSGTSQITVSGEYTETRRGSSYTKTFDQVINNVSWEANKKYIYVLTLSANGIVFNATVEEWKNGGTVDPDANGDSSIEM